MSGIALTSLNVPSFQRLKHIWIGLCYTRGKMFRKEVIRHAFYRSDCVIFPAQGQRR